MVTFAPPVNPDWGYEQTNEPRILEVPFGDGYSQSAQDGINNNPETVPLTWTNTSKAEKSAIIDFLKARGGHESFLYTLPDDTVEKRYKCKQFTSMAVFFNVYNVSATFIQVYQL